MAPAPRRPDGGGSNPAPANRETARAAQAGETSGDASADEQGAPPMNKLKLYMRGVAVVSLIVIAGVGVYKGRAMLAGKETVVASGEKGKGKGEKGKGKGEPGIQQAGTTKTAATTKPAVSSKSTASSKATASTKPETKKPGSALSSIGKQSVTTPPASTSKATSTDKKPSALSKYKFGGFNKGTGDKATASTSKPAPKPSGGYSLNDSSDTADTTGEDEYSANATPSEGTVDYGGGYSAEPAPVTTADTPYSAGSDDPLPQVEYGRTSPTSTADLRGSEPDSSDTGYQATDPAPNPPTFGRTEDSYAATPAAEEPTPAESPAPRSTIGSLRSPRVPRNATTASSGSTPPSAPKFGSLSDDSTSPAADNGLAETTTPTRSLPPNRLPGSSLRRTLPSRSAETTGRYADNLGQPADAADDITPISSTPTTFDNPSTLGAAVRPALEGPQTPTIEVEKFAPPEVQVGKAAKFEIVVRNVGRVPAYDVTVTDEVPRGTRFQQATPQATPARNGALLWKLGSLEPGQEKVIELQLVPEMEGEIGSVAQVSFQAQAGARSIVTRPKLEVRHETPSQVHAGDDTTLRITVANSGTGAASNVLLQSDVPQGFTHPAGNELEFEVGTLRPGESKPVELVMKAEQAGRYQLVFAVQGDGDLSVQESAEIEIVAPDLQVSVTGPRKRFVERQATHAITVSNPGTAAAKEVDLVAYLPRGFKFVSADHQGQYDTRQHAVVWGLDELPPGASGNVSLTTLPIEAGEQKLRVEGRTAAGLGAEFEQLVAVEASADLPFTIADLADPIEVGSDTTYEIRISNRGAKDATNVSVVVSFPPDLKPLAGEGAARAAVNGQKVEFAPLARVAPGAEIALTVRAEGLRAGDHRIAVAITTDEQPDPITREESTRVYVDQ